MSRILVIGDIHEPVAHPGYLTFCQDIYDQWDCDRVVFIGDVVDWHAISFHVRHPDAPGPSDEYALALAKIAKWHNAFPTAIVTIGNHDARIIRLAESVNIPSKFIRDYTETWDTPGWRWVDDTVIDDVYFFHGIGQGGDHPAYNAARKQLMSVCMGHVHHTGGVKWQVGPTLRIFGMDVGCGIDDQAYAFAYGRHNKRKSVLSCGVVIDGLPYHEIMPMAKGEAYYRGNFT